MQERDVSHADAIAHTDDARVGDDGLELRGAEIVHAQVDRRDAHAHVGGAAPDGSPAGSVGERAQDAAVERGAKRIADELVTERDFEARVPLLELDELHAEHPVERDAGLHEFFERVEVHGGSASAREELIVDPPLLPVGEDDEALPGRDLLDDAGVAVAVGPLHEDVRADGVRRGERGVRRGRIGRGLERRRLPRQRKLRSSRRDARRTGRHGVAARAVGG